jgi:hypothetical protein
VVLGAKGFTARRNGHWRGDFSDVVLGAKGFTARRNGHWRGDLS